MINLEELKKNPEDFKRRVARKGYDLDVEAVLSLDGTRRELIQEIERFRAESNKIAEKGKDTTAGDREKGKHLKEQVKIKEDERKIIEEQLESRLSEIPNPPMDEIPDGMEEKDNEEIRIWGKKTKFNFTPQDHLDLGETLDILDFKKGAKVTGSQFYYLKNEGVYLEIALIHYALDLLREKGFTILLTPDLARERFYKGTGYLPKGDEAQTYEIVDSDLGLIATAEVTLAGYHADEILEPDQLPLRYAGVSHCFRQEGGAYGKYSRGLYRVHQFTKVEMFAYSKPEDSPLIHDEFLDIEEKIFQGLGIPYRVVNNCAGELGFQAAKKYDIEAWMPGRGEWGEITSTSNTTDYQARNLNIRYKTESGTDFVHTLNGTAIAMSRTPIAILENYQQEDGSIKIPEVLHKYLPFKEIRRDG